jgi:hypothetical protein
VEDVIVGLAEVLATVAVDTVDFVFDIFEWVVTSVALPKRNDRNGKSQS